MALSDCPRWNRAEIAIAGRSNVGKSSLLNAIAGRKNLARISRTPGRTRCLNFFAVGERLALVDLPGYGFAKMARSEAARIAHLMQDYLNSRPHLAALMLLVDARRGPEREEFALADMLRDTEATAGGRRELILIATKCDKLKRSERDAAFKRFEAMGMLPIASSATSREGIDLIRRRILWFASPGHADAQARTDRPIDTIDE